MSIGLFGTKFSEILIEILTFSFKKMSLKVSSAKWRPFYLSLNVLTMIFKHTLASGYAASQSDARFETLNMTLIIETSKNWAKMTYMYTETQQNTTSQDLYILP